MTAFEILLNKFFETIERNEPNNHTLNHHNKTKELFQLIRHFIDTSFLHGDNLSYNNTISELMNKSADLLQKLPHEEWAKVKYVFMENDLHIIRRDRGKADVENLKMRLDQIF